MLPFQWWQFLWVQDFRTRPGDDVSVGKTEHICTPFLMMDMYPIRRRIIYLIKTLMIACVVQLQGRDQSDGSNAALI